MRLPNCLRLAELLIRRVIWLVGWLVIKKFVELRKPFCIQLMPLHRQSVLRSGTKNIKGPCPRMSADIAADIELPMSAEEGPCTRALQHTVDAAA